MKNYEKHLHEILQNADAETLRKIAEATPSADIRTKERIFKSICTSCHIQNSESFETEAYPAIVESRFSGYKNFAVAAACLLVCGGVVGGLSTMQKPLTTLEQTEQITMEELTEAISTTTALVSNIKTAEKSTQQAKNTNSVKSKETVINTVPVIVPVAETVPAVNAETAVNPETTAPTAETATVQTTAVPVDNTEKETVSADFVPLVNPVPAENVALPQNVETTAPETTIAVETTAIIEETRPITEKNSLGAFKVEREEKDDEIHYYYYIDGDVTPSNADIVKYSLTYIPDGFKLLKHPDSVLIYDWYVLGEGSGMIFFELSNISFSNNCVGSYFFNPDGDAKFSYESTTVNGYPALLINNDEGYSLYWHDGTQWYNISTRNVSLDDVMKMAESVQPIDTVDTKTPTNIETSNYGEYMNDVCVQTEMNAEVLQ